MMNARPPLTQQSPLPSSAPSADRYLGPGLPTPTSDDEGDGLVHPSSLVGVGGVGGGAVDAETAIRWTSEHMSRVAGGIACWYASSVGLTVLNKCLFDTLGLNFPLLVTFTHFAFVSLIVRAGFACCSCFPRPSNYNPFEAHGASPNSASPPSRPPRAAPRPLSDGGGGEETSSPTAADGWTELDVH
eukprot:Selendium_serpulae@DN4490_c0_g1_i2.p1